MIICSKTRPVPERSTEWIDEIGGGHRGMRRLAQWRCLCYVKDKLHQVYMFNTLEASACNTCS